MLLTCYNKLWPMRDFEARLRNCRVVLHTSEDCTVAGSPELLRSAVENAIRNAIRYTARAHGSRCQPHV